MSYMKSRAYLIQSLTNSHTSDLSDVPTKKQELQELLHEFAREIAKNPLPKDWIDAEINVRVDTFLAL